jgi:hypothetical protein
LFLRLLRACQLRPCAPVTKLHNTCASAHRPRQQRLRLMCPIPGIEISSEM